MVVQVAFSTLFVVLVFGQTCGTRFHQGHSSRVHFLRQSAEMSILSDTSRNSKDASAASKSATSSADGGVLGHHKTVYSEPQVKNDYVSNPTFDPRGMQHVYTLSQTFMDLVQRNQVLPPLVALQASERNFSTWPHLLLEHKEDLLLQHIGVLTVAVCGILVAIALPVVGVCVCCCRCSGKCGGYPEHFDKKGDVCKRIFYGILLSICVIAATFGVVSVFVTNQYAYNGINNFPDRLLDSSEDARLYLRNTGVEVNSLLVTNFQELEEVLNGILDNSGPILKRSLARVSEAVAIDNLANIVSGLSEVKRHLRDIRNNTLVLQGKVQQLRLGLNGTRVRLEAALKQCEGHKSCRTFLQEYNINKDLAVAGNFEQLPLQLPDLSNLLEDVTSLMQNNIVSKVRTGQEQLDRVKADIQESIGDVLPTVRNEIRRMGETLSAKSAQINDALNEIETYIALTFSPQQGDGVPSIIGPPLVEYSDYVHYVGLGASLVLLLVLACFVCGLFCGFCGKRPGNVYGGDDCCNAGTGANWLLAGIILFFLTSFVLLLLATAGFLSGSSARKWVCQPLDDPATSDVFLALDARFQQEIVWPETPLVVANGSSVALDGLSLVEVISGCHNNLTIYELLKLSRVYDVRKLRNWRDEYGGVSRHINDLKSKIRADDLRDIQILSPQARENLEELASSQLSDLNFTQYARLVEDGITAVDLSTFGSRLQQVVERLGLEHSRLVGPTLANEALALDSMKKVLGDMKMVVRRLKSSVLALRNEVGLGVNDDYQSRSSLRQDIRDLVRQASKASEFLRSEGPQLVDNLADQYVNETAGLIDDYVERVIFRTLNNVGKCHPISSMYNATVNAVCGEVIDPFNGFWASVGWCLFFYMIGIPFALILVSLYRKSEPYPGPLVDHISDEFTSSASVAAGHGGKKNAAKRRHRRNPSEYLPDSAHHRRGGNGTGASTTSSNGARNSYQLDRNVSRFQDVAPRNYNASGGSSAPPVQDPGPPRYSSNPTLDEYERPPPYYPGAPPSAPLPLTGP